MILRSLAQLELSTLISGSARLGLSLLILAVAKLEFFLSLKTILQLGPFMFCFRAARFGISLVVLDVTTMDFSLFLHSLCRLDLFLLVLGLATFGPISSIFVTHVANPDSSMFPKSFSRLEFSTLVLDFSNLELPSSPQHLSYLDFSLLVLGAGSLRGALELSSSLSVADCSHLGFLVSAHSFVQLEVLLLIFSYVHLGFPIALKGLMQLEFFMLPPGGLRMDSFLVALQHLHMEPLIFLHSSAQIGASSSVPSSVALGVSSSPQRFARADSPTSLPGPVHLEPVTLAVDFVHLNFSASSRSFGQLGFPPATFDAVYLGSSPLLQGSACSDSSTPVYPCASFAALSVAYSVSLGSLLPAHSLARLGPSMLVLDAVATGSTPSLRSVSCAEFSPPVLGTARAELFSLVLGNCHAGFSSPPKSFL